MSFEIRYKDLLGRIGRLETKSGTIETPILFPVINPSIQLIPPKMMRKVFDCKAIITNANIIKKNFKEETVQKGIHDFLSFTGVVMTDSGAYQTLVYGDAEVYPQEIVEYQEEINVDIATILDVPTGWSVSEQHAKNTVKETLRRGESLSKMKTREDIIWVGPVQGGRYLDLVAWSAREMGKLPFQIHALGSPTPVMERYLFDTLIDMIMTAKTSLPLERPLHLFGAGHPLMFALAVALGCDLFDSAAYAKFARGGRYMTEYGTIRLDNLEYLSCSCPTCVKNSPRTLLTMPKMEKQKMLALHNLYTSFSELRRIKQAIREGRLWELIQLRAHGHPAILKGLKRIKKYCKYVEEQSPVTKRRGLSFFGFLDLIRPEVVRHKKRLFERYTPPRESKILLLLPQTEMKPLRKSRKHIRLLQALREELGDKIKEAHICLYAAPFGVIPKELYEVYPLSQYEITTPLDSETIDHTASQVAKYVRSTNYKEVILILGPEPWNQKIAAVCKRVCSKKALPLNILRTKKILK